MSCPMAHAMGGTAGSAIPPAVRTHGTNTVCSCNSPDRYAVPGFTPHHTATCGPWGEVVTATAVRCPTYRDRYQPVDYSPRCTVDTDTETGRDRRAYWLTGLITHRRRASGGVDRAKGVFARSRCVRATANTLSAHPTHATGTGGIMHAGCGIRRHTFRQCQPFLRFPLCERVTHAVFKVLRTLCVRREPVDAPTPCVSGLTRTCCGQTPCVRRAPCVSGSRFVLLRRCGDRHN